MQRSASGIPSTLDHLRNQWNRLESGELLEFTFLDERIAGRYKSEHKVKKLVSYFSCLAILIACFGLYGLVSFMTEARTKEIGIRRVLGAPVAGITLELSREFLKWVLLANVMAIPLAYVMITQWLQNFAFHITVGIWMFVFSTFLTLVISLATVSFQSVKAARADPVRALRFE